VKRLFVIIVVSLVVASADCGGPVEAPTFTQLRSDVFTPRCGNATGCHTADNPPHGLDLLTDPHAALVGQDSFVDPSKKLVVAGDPANSLLLTVLKQGVDSDDPALAVRQMPPGVVLPPEILADIEAWIAAGAEDN
jgi:hypothetical protein